MSCIFKQLVSLKYWSTDVVWCITSYIAPYNKKPKLIFKNRIKDVEHLCLAQLPNDRLACGSKDGSICIWNLKMKKIIKKWKMCGFSWSMMCAIDDNFIVCVAQNTHQIFIFDMRLSSCNIIKEYKEITMWSYCIQSLMYLGNNLLMCMTYTEIFICDLTKHGQLECMRNDFNFHNLNSIQKELIQSKCDELKINVNPWAPEFDMNIFVNDVKKIRKVCSLINKECDPRIAVIRGHVDMKTSEYHDLLMSEYMQKRTYLLNHKSLQKYSIDDFLSNDDSKYTKLSDLVFEQFVLINSSHVAYLNNISIDEHKTLINIITIRNVEDMSCLKRIILQDYVTSMTTYGQFLIVTLHNEILIYDIFSNTDELCTRNLVLSSAPIQIIKCQSSTLNTAVCLDNGDLVTIVNKYSIHVYEKIK